MADKNTSHLAGEFLVAGELSRRGYPVSITMGNAKSVDIYVETQGGKETIAVDAKASRYNTDWPISESSVKENLYYIFVYLRSKEGIRKNEHPEYFIICGAEITSKRMVKAWGKMQGIKYSTLNTNEYRERWDKLPPP